jgi:hypothetical protein
MPDHDPLLPGITERDCPPRVVCDPRPEIRRARRRALLRDAAQLGLVIAVDALLIRWPAAHVPMMSRADSLMLVAALNAIIAASVWLTRMLPRWSAKRIAATWCPAERSRFVAVARVRGSLRRLPH